MKYRILLIFIATISLCATAQRSIEPHFYIGAKGGVSLSKVNFSPAVPQSFLMGPMGGIMVRYSEENYFGLIAELNFVTRGWKESFDDAPFEYNRSFTYIHLPILTHIFFGSNTIKGFFNLGPEIAFMVGESISSNFEYKNATNVPDFPLTHRYEQYNLDVNSKFDYGISAGLGMEAIIKNRHSLLIEGRFYYGLGNVFSSHKTDYFSASPNMSIMVSLGYMFKLK